LTILGTGTTVNKFFVRMTGLMGPSQRNVTCLVFYQSISGCAAAIVGLGAAASTATLGNDGVKVRETHEEVKQKEVLSLKEV
jgi:hypothetical protein